MCIFWNNAIVIPYLVYMFVLTVDGKCMGYGENLDDSIQFFVYTRQNNDTPQLLVADVESIVRSFLNPSKPTTLSIHGEMGDKNAEEYSIIKNSKLRIEDANIITVDYSSLIFDKDFEAAYFSIDLVSKAITDLVVLLHDSFNMSLQNVHIVGFSLGGQIAGLVGQNIYQRCGEKVKRITALDPTGILFTETTAANEKLTPDDAVYVEVVHTNAGEYGYRAPCGHVDYYPNGGKIQPGCNNTDNKICSHNRAYSFIPEMWSPVENHELLLLKCENVEFMSLNSCRWLNEKMGVLEKQLQGLYYLETNDNSPFGKGAFKSQFL